MTSAPLSVLQVNSADVGGGAEKVVSDLHAEYLRRGLDSWVAVGHRQRKDPRIMEIPNDATRSPWARALTAAAQRVESTGEAATGLRKLASRALLLGADPSRYRDIYSGIEDFHYPGTARILDLAPARPDVLHLHNLHGYYFDIRLLPELSALAPTVVTLHDAWLLTGHCAHPFDCERWRDGCGNCSDLGVYPPIRKDSSRTNQRIKREAFQASSARLATPSQWLMRLVEDSGLLGDSREARVIPNGIDDSVFAPGDRLAARAELSLPPDREIVLFTANALRNNPFKDFTTLLSALPRISELRPTPPLLVALGDASASELVPDLEVLAVPFLDHAEKVARYYQAADIYVHPARAENLPLAIIEAMACGTPVVATRVGGVPELVADGESGTLVPLGDARELADAVVHLLDDEALRASFSAEGVAKVAERFTLKRQADAYIAWYEELRTH